MVTLLKTANNHLFILLTFIQLGQHYTDAFFTVQQQQQQPSLPFQAARGFTITPRTLTTTPRPRRQCHPSGFAVSSHHKKQSRSVTLQRRYVAINEDEPQTKTQRDNDGNNPPPVNEKRLIVESASILLPFPPEIAFDAFSDLPRQPLWSPWLRSVTYVDDDEDEENATASTRPNGVGRSSRWTLRVKGLTLGWNAVATALEKPHLIEWESTSGVKNMGSVQFTFAGDDDRQCQMILTMTVVAPRALAALFRKSERIGDVFREKFLMSTLERFRDVVLKDYEDMEEEVIRGFDE